MKSDVEKGISMTKIVLYIATSQDGFIADEKGGVDWLPQTPEETGGQDYGYQAFYDSVDATAIGRKTYEQILGFGDWPYFGKASYIFSRSHMESPNKEIEFVAEGICEFIKSLEGKNVKKLWLVGGSELINAFYKQGRIDEFIITVFPKVLNNGIPLDTLKNALLKDELVQMQSIEYGDGVLQNHYSMRAKGSEDE
jgi:dihydrofolate reductase